MPSSSVRVRPVTEADLPVLLALGDELRESGLGAEAMGKRGGTMATRAVLAQRYCEAIADPARHLVLAVGGKAGEVEVVLGMALLTIGTASALVDIPAVHLSHSMVSGRHRKRGAGKALVAAAVAYAEERGIEQLVVSVHPGSRDGARFFARLGFAPQSVRRTAPVAVVRRRLSAGDRVPEQAARRRSLRPVRPAVPLGGADGADS